MAAVAGVLLVLLSASSAPADFVRPEEAGFHHCVLIYDSETRAAEDLLPHVAHLSADGTPDEWLFDAFLYLPHSAGPSSGASYHNGPTNRSDWEAMLDGWFAEGHGFPALQAAIDRAEETLGSPLEPLRAIITIPYPSRDQTDFGDVDGDRASELFLCRNPSAIESTQGVTRGAVR